jgi:hypothetical protein
MKKDFLTITPESGGGGVKGNIFPVGAHIIFEK